MDAPPRPIPTIQTPTRPRTSRCTSSRPAAGMAAGATAGRAAATASAGFVRFLLFALVLAGVVLLVAITALRPLVNSAILGWAADNPAALELPFVHDIVRDDIGAAMTQPAASDPAQVEFVVEQGDTASTIATRLQRDGLLRDARAFVMLASDRGIEIEAAGRHVPAAQEHDPERPGDRAARPARRTRTSRSPCGPGSGSSRSPRSSRRCPSRWTRRTSTTRSPSRPRR